MPTVPIPLANKLGGRHAWQRSVVIPLTPASKSLDWVHQPPSPNARSEAAPLELRPALEVRKSRIGSRPGAPPILAASDELDASLNCRSRLAWAKITSGQVSRRSNLLPVLSTKTYGDGKSQPKRRADATVAPAGPLTRPKGCAAPLKSGSAARQAVSRSRSLAKLSHTARAHSRIGSVASCEPGS